MPRTCLATCALAGVLVEDVVLRAGGSGQNVANTLAGVAVEVPVGTAVLSLIPARTHALTGFHVQFLIGAAHIC